MATKFLWQYEFPTTLEKEVWVLHTEGKSIREIAAELHSRGFRFFKDKIHHIVRHLESIMRGQESPYQKKIEGQLSFGEFAPQVKKDE